MMAYKCPYCEGDPAKFLPGWTPCSPGRCATTGTAWLTHMDGTPLGFATPLEIELGESMERAGMGHLVPEMVRDAIRKNEAPDQPA